MLVAASVDSVPLESKLNLICSLFYNEGVGRMYTSKSSVTEQTTDSDAAVFK
jgi:hypothetical protein